MATSRKSTRGERVPPCDPHMVAAYDYSRLGPEFARLSRPAQRALLNAGICTARDLAQHRERDVLALHGIGPSALPVLHAALTSQRLRFRS